MSLSLQTLLTTTSISGRLVHGLKAKEDTADTDDGKFCDHEDKDKIQQQQTFKQKVEMLQADLTRRQESYIRRERAFNMRIKELEEEVGNLKAGKMSWMQGNHSMESLKTMHRQILRNVEMVQDRSSEILQEQERDLLRAFRARLFDVQIELESEKSRKDGRDNAWIERTRTTEAELDRAKEVADRLDRLNQDLSRENLRLKSHFKSQEDDRKYLVKQLVAVKKENQSLRHEREAAEASMFEIQRKAMCASEGIATVAVKTQKRSSSSAPNLPGLGLTSSRRAGTDTDNRYKWIIKRMKWLLDTERRTLRQVRSAYTAELQQRTELENMLRAAVEDVRRAIVAKRAGVVKPTTPIYRKRIIAAPDPALSPSSSVGVRHDDARNLWGLFSTKEREQTLEMLLSRERVLTLLYSRTFPLTSTLPSNIEPGEVDVSNRVVSGAGSASQANGEGEGAIAT